MKIKIQSKLSIIESVDFFEFSGGEVHVKIPELTHSDEITITCYLKNSSDVMALLMVTDAIKRQYHSGKIRLILPYLPYARQDKISDYGESLSLKVFADILNNQNYEQIITYDVHSDVSLALINNLKSISQKTILSYAEKIPELHGKILVSPDFGASKKTRDVAKFIKPSAIIQADKSRDANGNIVGISVFCDNLKNDDVVIVDDICDGGKTFIELAKALKEKNAGRIYLFVTHGIFSKGVDCLFSAGISHVFTTDTFTTIQHEKLTVINIVGNIL